MLRSQQPTVLRQSSRQFDSYGPVNPAGALYPSHDSMARYDARRMDNRFVPGPGNATMNGAPFYDLGNGSQTWNGAAANAFAGAPQTLATPTLGPMAPIGSQTSRLRSSRPRGALPGVSYSDTPAPVQLLILISPAMARAASYATATLCQHGTVAPGALCASRVSSRGR